jgi:hypothetical protein
VLAYLFWHRPEADVDAGSYEQAQRRFHARIESPSACFHGRLNAAAVDAGRRAEHDAAAALVGEGWGGVYAVVRGAAAIPAAASWRHKPRGRDLETVLADAGDAAVWQRQMVLGPAPELCLAAGGPPRRRIT